ncbi:VanZ family protein [Colwellia sp. MEBiC06753]
MKNLHHILFFLIILLATVTFSFSSELRETISSNTHIDSFGHFIGFFLLSWILSSLLKLPSFPLACALIAYAALSEVGQHYLGFRNGELRDFVADLVGIFTFMLLKWLWLVYGKPASN